MHDTRMIRELDGVKGIHVLWSIRVWGLELRIHAIAREKPQTFRRHSHALPWIGLTAPAFLCRSYRSFVRVDSKFRIKEAFFEDGAVPERRPKAPGFSRSDPQTHVGRPRLSPKPKRSGGKGLRAINWWVQLSGVQSKH